MTISEKNFESTIEASLLEPLPAGQTVVSKAGAIYQSSPTSYVPGGYRQRSHQDYDRALCLIPSDVFDFIYSTQPKVWEKFAQQHGADAKTKFLQRLSQLVEQRGTLDILRNGIKATGSKFKIAYFRPASGLNPTIQTLYETNIFTVVRQLRYSLKNENSLDLVIFLNGLPLFTAELKNPLNGQNVQDAMRQYRESRDPHEPLFALRRCLAHFAVDPGLVYVTTRLSGPQTEFLPFNQGNGTGAGNPAPSFDRFATAYLWEQVWARVSVLNLIQQFVHEYQDEDDKGKPVGPKKIMFPRYHQLDSVRRLVADAKANGTGRSYLIQHSAGSGKSNSIAWLAHQLSSLHDASDQGVFDSVIVITDRRVLDDQLQRAVRWFQQTIGLVENIDKTSKQLKSALEDGKKIIVCTLQKFGVIAQEMHDLPGKRFAVIIDEAHSSQSGESTKSLKSVLSSGSLEEAEKDDAGDGEGDDLEDRIAEVMRKRGRLENVSYFAFTATPKAKTMELFGEPQLDGSFVPFSLYAMRQAIEEHFILDVLENYTTYKTYFNLLKKIEDDPSYDRNKATYLLRSFVDLHEHAIQQKVEIMVEHFVQNTMSRIGGTAKAMIVTRSRLHAVRYKFAIDAYLAQRGYTFKSLVAFSGTVKDSGIDFTEAGMNGIPETQTATAFKGNEYRLLIAANKFQTGFDQPLLHTMYVDKKLGGVNAVQTLSRLNRTLPAKTETMVLDFANDADEIQKAFQPYYERTLLGEGTDPNLLHDLEMRLSDFGIFDQTDLDKFAASFFAPKVHQEQLYAVIDPVVDRFQELSSDEQQDVRKALTDYVRLYAFLSQVVTFVDADLEKLYAFGRHLLRRLPIQEDRLPLDVLQNIDMETYRIRETFTGKVQLERGSTPVLPVGAGESAQQYVPAIEPLSQIIKDLNDRFGAEITEDDRILIKGIQDKLAKDDALGNSVRVNTRDNAKLTFDIVLDDYLQGLIDSNFRFYKKITDDPEMGKYFRDQLFSVYCETAEVGSQ